MCPVHLSCYRSTYLTLNVFVVLSLYPSLPPSLSPSLHHFLTLPLPFSQSPSFTPSTKQAKHQVISTRSGYIAVTGGHQKPVTLKPISCIFYILRVFVSAFAALSAFLQNSLCGNRLRPLFFHGAKDLLHFPHFPCIRFESLISKVRPTGFFMTGLRLAWRRIKTKLVFPKLGGLVLHAASKQ